MLSSKSSQLSLRQQHVSAEPKPQPPTTTMPAASPKAEARKPEGRSLNFVLADMDGRNPRDNRVCASCIFKLARSEVGQVNWHLTGDQPCHLCQIALGKPEAYTKPFTDFLEENPTIFHTVEHFKKKLNHVGFTEVWCPHRDSQPPTDPPSFLHATPGSISCSPAASTTSHETAPLSSPSPSVRRTGPATASA